MSGKQKKETQKSRLEKELAALIPEIEEEGLLFLLQQANIIIHNQRAEVVNRELEELNTRKGERKAKPAGDTKWEITIDTPDNGKTYHFTVNGRKHFLDTSETRKIVELCYRPPEKSAALKYLYQFLYAERDEILYEHKITSEKSPFFDALFTEVRARFRL